MADLVFLDSHTRPRPSKQQIENWAKWSESSWWSGPVPKAVEQIGDLLGAQDHHLTLTGGLDEAHFQVVSEHYIDCIRTTGRTHIVTLEGEQSSILRAIKRLETFEVRGNYLPFEQLTESALREVIRARTSLLSISWAHPHSGVIQPIHDLIAVCKEHEIKVHLDVSVAVGKLFFQLSDLDVDYLTIDGRLLNLPVEIGAIFSKEKLFSMRPYPYPYYAALASGLTGAFAQMDHYAMEVGRLRDRLEEKLQAAGATILYQEYERLPNTAVLELPQIHGEKGIELLKKEGIFASKSITRPSAISFALSDTSSEADVHRVVSVFEAELSQLKKSPFVSFSEEDARAKNMRVTEGVCKTKGYSVRMSLLVDEEDGVIADCRIDPFGPMALEAAAKAVETILLRKNYMQARRVTADLIEKECKGAKPKSTHLNLLIDAIDEATEECFDIPIEDVYVAPPEMGNGERTEYPGWEQLSNEQKKIVITEVMERDIVPYVELDAGGVEVVKVEENRITIRYSGNCTSCYSATGATLDAIGNILRHNLYPDLMVIPDMGAGLQNESV